MPSKKLCFVTSISLCASWEIVPQAIENARENAERNGIKNTRFICADAASAAIQLRDEGIRPDVIVVDPPRKGLTPELIVTVAEMSPDRVVYVSCDPATLARDLKLFTEHEYSKEITPVDMFPRTSHVESVVLMSRPMTSDEKYGEYFMNRSVADIMEEWSEWHDEWQ